LGIRGFCWRIGWTYEAGWQDVVIVTAVNE